MSGTARTIPFFVSLHIFHTQQPSVPQSHGMTLVWILQHLKINHDILIHNYAAELKSRTNTAVRTPATEVTCT
jgi:hypothetical protein